MDFEKKEMDIKKLLEEQIASIENLLKNESNRLGVHEIVMLHQQLESYIKLYTAMDFH